MCQKRFEHILTDIDLEMAGITQVPEDATIFKAASCSACNYRGYSSLTTVSELLLITEEIKALILQKADAGSVKKMAMSLGMTTLKQDALSKVYMGITSIEEMVRAINEEDGE